MTRVFATDSEQALLSLYGSVVNEDRYLDFLDQVQQAIQSKFLVLGMFDPHDPSREVHRFAAPRTIGLDGARYIVSLHRAPSAWMGPCSFWRWRRRPM